MNKDRPNEIDSSAPVSEQASHWWIVLNAGQPTAADHKAFGEWAARSPERIEAFLETARLTKVLTSKQLRWPDTPVETLARQVDSAGADVLPLRHSQPGQSAHRHPFKSSFLFAVAASVMAILAGTWLFLSPMDRYQTSVGELRSVALEDGSLVTLNTASRMEVKFDQRRRLIHLLAGEALFDVARDHARPFDVVVGGTTVRAVGTQFNIDRRARHTVVTVVEGKVSVENSRTTLVAAGEQLTISVSKTAAKAPVTKRADLTAATAWTQWRLVFDHRPIGEVAEEFNRYNRLQIEIASPELRAEEMTAVFQANDPESFLDFIAKMPDVKIERHNNSVKVKSEL